MDPEVTLKLGASSVNLILQALHERPFREVAALVGEIMAQAQPQVAAASQVQPEGSALVADLPNA